MEIKILLAIVPMIMLTHGISFMVCIHNLLLYQLSMKMEMVNFLHQMSCAWCLNLIFFITTCFRCRRYKIPLKKKTRVSLRLLHFQKRNKNPRNRRENSICKVNMGGVMAFVISMGLGKNDV